MRVAGEERELLRLIKGVLDLGCWRGVGEGRVASVDGVCWRV